MKKHFFIIIFFAISNFVLAQQELSKEKATELSLPSKNIEGTYQIQVINNERAQPSIPGNLKQLVQEKRDATKIVYVTLGTHVRLKILPLSEINTPDFKPLPQIIHIAE